MGFLKAWVFILLVQSGCELYNLPLNNTLPPPSKAFAAITNFQQLREAVAAAPSGKASTLLIKTDFNTFSKAPYPAPPVEIENKTIILSAGSSDRNITRETTLLSSFFLVKAGGELILGETGSQGRLSLTGNSGANEGFVNVETGGKLTMNKNAALMGNSAGSAKGGAVTLSGTFVMNGGEIRGNTAASGGGVYISGGGSFRMSGGTIGGNSAPSGKGVYIASNAGFFMSGAAAVAPDNDVYVHDGSCVTVEHALAGTFPAATLTPENYTVTPLPVRLLTSGQASVTAAEAPKFAVTQPPGTTRYRVDSNGCLSVSSGIVRLASNNTEYSSLQAALNMAAVEDTVYILDNIVMTAQSETADIPTGKKITLLPFGSEKRITRGGASPFESLIRVSKGAVLKLSGGQGNLILDGAGLISKGALIYVQDALLEIENGVSIQNNNNTYSGTAPGGGVNIYCTANMTALIMSGGTIKGNKAGSAGGIYAKGADIRITGGKIEENDSSNSYNNGSILIDDGTFLLSGQAEIRNNKTRGVCINSGTFTMTGGLIEANAGGGVYVGNAALIMSKGEIKANNGDGIFIDGGSVVMSGSARIGAQSSGHGINFSSGSMLSMEGDVLVESTVRLIWDKFITVKGDLTQPYPVATITPSVYARVFPVVKLDGVSDTDLFAKFAVTPSGAVKYHVNSSGYSVPSLP
ncbi:MAG: carbohydrate-binding domain-containing protein [Spirochaetaceae bacterium]|nr:carbohydrate-binding domain-containing protein [Spirochaetaceae bacterium]